MARCNTRLIFPAAASKGTASPEDNELRRSPAGYRVALTRHGVVMFLKDDKLLAIFTLCWAANEFYSRCEKELRALRGVKAITKFYNPICKRLTLLWSPLQPLFHLQLTLQQGLSVFLWGCRWFETWVLILVTLCTKGNEKKDIKVTFFGTKSVGRQWNLNTQEKFNDLQ